MSLNWGLFNQGSVTYDDMKYLNLQFHSPPGSGDTRTSDLVDRSIRPRRHTWPVEHLFGHSYFPEETQPTLLDPVSSPRASRNGEKRTKKSNSVPKSPTSQQSPKTAQQPRRKLTTHKLSAKSYVDLITEAISSTSEKRMTLADIYKWMVANVPCFKEQANVSASSGWKNAVRHTLSLHKRFKRIQRGRLQKPAWWTIQDSECDVDQMLGGVCNRSPESTVPSKRHYNEICVDKIKKEVAQTPPAYTPMDVHSTGHPGSFQAASDWSMATGPTQVADTDTKPWERPLQRHAAVSSSTSLDGEDSGCGSFPKNDGHSLLFRSTSDASSYGSPHHATALSQSFSSLDYEKSYEGLEAEYQYNQNVVTEFGQLTELQSVMVRTETGAVAHITVPMPLRVDVRHQANQQAQTTQYITNDNITRLPIFEKLCYPGRYPGTDIALPHDLLGVQVDSDVQCNVAEVLAYEMRASTDGTETAPVVNDLYDLLKAGCALD